MSKSYCGAFATRGASLLAVGEPAALLVPAGAASAQDPDYVDPPGAEGRSDGRELLTPTCVPKAARAATAERGKIKFVMCDDNVTVESIATTSDIIFYPKFSPDRHNYVVYMPDDLTEVRFVAIFKNFFPSRDALVYERPGWAFAHVEADSGCGRLEGLSPGFVLLPSVRRFYTESRYPQCHFGWI